MAWMYSKSAFANANGNGHGSASASHPPGLARLCQLQSLTIASELIAINIINIECCIDGNTHACTGLQAAGWHSSCRCKHAVAMQVKNTSLMPRKTAAAGAAAHTNSSISTRSVPSRQTSAMHPSCEGLNRRCNEQHPTDGVAHTTAQTYTRIEPCMALEPAVAAVNAA